MNWSVLFVGFFPPHTRFQWPNNTWYTFSVCPTTFLSQVSPCSSSQPPLPLQHVWVVMEMSFHYNNSRGSLVAPHAREPLNRVLAPNDKGSRTQRWSVLVQGSAAWIGSSVFMFACLGLLLSFTDLQWSFSLVPRWCLLIKWWQLCPLWLFFSFFFSLHVFNST